MDRDIVKRFSGGREGEKSQRRREKKRPDSNGDGKAWIGIIR